MGSGRDNGGGDGGGAKTASNDALGRLGKEKHCPTMAECSDPTYIIWPLYKKCQRIQFYQFYIVSM